MDLVKSAVIVTIVAILLGALLIPAINDATEDVSIVDIIIVDGQSNAEDWASFSTIINSEYSATPAEDLYYYGSPTSTTHYTDSAATIATYGIQPMYSDNKWVIGGYGPVLCNQYAAKNGHDVCYINIGRSGQSITALLPSASIGSWGFDIVDKAITALRSDYDKLNMIGWIWAQGEADKNMAIDTYTADFKIIQSKFGTYGLNDCYIIHTREYYGGNATEAQAAIAESESNVVMTCLFTEKFTESGGELQSGDPIHYTQKGRNIIAAELASVIPNKTVSIPSLDLLQVIPFVIIAAVLVSMAAVVIRSKQ